MWIDLALRHPVEVMFVNTILNLPLLYAAFTLAAMTQKRVSRGGISPAHRVLVLLCVGALWAASTLVDTAMLSALLRGEIAILPELRENPVAVLYPVSCAMAIALVRRNGVRALILLAAVAFSVLQLSGLRTNATFNLLNGELRANIWITIASGALLMAAGAYLMATRSHPGRASAVLMLAWGTKLVIYGRLSGVAPYFTVLQPQEGLLTPSLLMFVTAGVLGVGLIALFESARLRRGDGARELLAESERRMRMLADATQEALVIHEDGSIIEANDRFRSLSGERNCEGHKLQHFLPEAVDWSIEERHELPPSDTQLRATNGDEIAIEAVCRKLDDRRIVTAIRDVTERHHAQERIRFLAEKDPLTGLMNRRSFDLELDRRLRTVRREGEPPHLALMMIDLDRFKPVNDTYGHAVGDALLRALADRFTAALRSPEGDRGGDVVARLGGDEFVALAWIHRKEEAEGLAERLRVAATQAVGIEGYEVAVGASIGYAVGSDDGDNPKELRWCADIALYAAKHSGRGRTVAFAPRMAEETRERLALEKDLRGALSRGEISLHYQVQHDIKAGQAVGYEALMRWNRPERGMVPPSEFIPVAEETGLIVMLGRWALERAARDFAYFDDATRVSVNVSPVQFRNGDIVRDVTHALESSDLAPSRLEIEITEELLLRDTEEMLERLDELRALGVSLSLDDFGSGYSSLSYLTRFPFTKIKIDRSFINRMSSDDRTHALVRSMLSLAASLDLKVTAEGVETHAQLMVLAKGQCDEAQGYLLGRPMPFSELRNSATGAARDVA